MFAQDVVAGLWRFSPVTDNLLRRTAAMVLAAPDSVFLRTSDAIHLMTAQDLGESEVWTNDRHMQDAAPLFGLAARSFGPLLRWSLRGPSG